MKNLTLISSFFMIAMCSIMTYYLLFTDLMADRLYGTERAILTGLMIVYGLYRCYRVVTLLKNEKRKSV
jgi:hypothetical protein